MAEDPYTLWLQVPPGQRSPDHYTLLKLPPFCDNRPKIEAAARSQLARLDRYAIHPDPQKRATCNRLMNEVAKARVVLASADRKSGYDRQLAARLGLAPPADFGAPEQVLITEDNDGEADRAADAYLAEIASAARAVRTAPAKARTKTFAPPHRWLPIAVAAGSFSVVLLIGYWLFLRPGVTPQRVSVVPPIQHASEPPPVLPAPTRPARTRPSPIQTSSDADIGLHGKLFGDMPHPATRDFVAREGEREVRPYRSPRTDTRPVAVAVSPGQGMGASALPKIAANSPSHPQPALPPRIVKLAQPPTPVMRLPQRLPVPNAAERATAESLIRDLLKPKVSASAADRDAFARKLLDAAAQTHDQPASEYILLSEASNQAAKAGNVEMALQAAWRMQDLFAVDGKALTSQVLSTALHATPSTPEAARGSSRAEIILAASCLDDGNYDLAARAAALADATVVRASDPALTARVRSLTQLIEAIGSKRREVAPALQTLATNPQDPASNLSAGRFYCFILNEWNKGLPLLAKGADPALKTLADQDLRAPASASARAALANAWRDAARLGDLRQVMEQRAMQQRAVFWYQQAIPDLVGLRRLELQKRVIAIRTAHLSRGLVAEFFIGRSFGRRLLTRIDPTIDFNWHGKSPVPEGPEEWFTARWSGWIKPAITGTYKFVVKYDDGGRLTVDGKLIIDRWGATGEDEASINLTAEPHEITLEYEQIAGDSYLGLAWVLPGDKRTRVVPAEVLLHEPLTLEQQLPPRIKADANGSIHLTPLFADVHGTTLRFVDPDNEPDRLGGWTNQNEWASWTFAGAGQYEVSIARGCPDSQEGGTYAVSVGGRDFTDSVPKTGGFARLETKLLGNVSLAAGLHTLSIRATTKPHEYVMDAGEVTLTPMK